MPYDVVYDNGKSYNVDRETGTRTEIVAPVRPDFEVKLVKRAVRLRADLRSFLDKVNAGTETAADRNQATVKLIRLHLAESRLARGDTDSDEADPSDT